MRLYLLQRYRTEVYAKDLSQPNSPWMTMPELPDARMWHGCVEAQVDGVQGKKFRTLTLFQPPPLCRDSGGGWVLQWGDQHVPPPGVQQGGVLGGVRARQGLTKVGVALRSYKGD